MATQCMVYERLLQMQTTLQGEVSAPSGAESAPAIDGELPSACQQPAQQSLHATEGVSVQGHGKRKRQATEKFAALQQESQVRS